MRAERPMPEEIADAEGMPMQVKRKPEAEGEDVHTSVNAIHEADPNIWSDRQAVDHFGFIPEGVIVPSTERTVRFPAWREQRR